MRLCRSGAIRYERLTAKQLSCTKKTKKPIALAAKSQPKGCLKTCDDRTCEPRSALRRLKDSRSSAHLEAGTAHYRERSRPVSWRQRSDSESLGGAKADSPSPRN